MPQNGSVVVSALASGVRGPGHPIPAAGEEKIWCTNMLLVSFTWMALNKDRDVNWRPPVQVKEPNSNLHDYL